MKKRLLALLIAVICIIITAVGSFAYSPNEKSTLNKMYPDHTYFYGSVPSNGLGLSYVEALGTGQLLRCPACDNPVIGIEIPISTYTANDTTYINSEVMNGVYITGYYELEYVYTFGGRLTVGFNNQGDDREYGQNVDRCANTELEDYLNTLDLMFIYDSDYGNERAFIYSHALPEGSYGISNLPYVQVLCIPDLDKFGHTNPLFETVLNNYYSMTYDYNEIGEYYEYNNRVIRPVPFNTLYGNIINGGYDDGYEEGYQIGYDDGYNIGYEEGEALSYASGYNEGYGYGYDYGLQEGYTEGFGDGKSEGYQNGYNTGVIDGQGSIDALDIVFEGIFTGLGGFFAPVLSLGIGNLTIALLVGFVATFALVMLIIKIIRG